MSSDIKYFLVKLRSMEKDLGGNSNAKKAQVGKSKDEFVNGEHMIMQLIRDIQNLQTDRDDRIAKRQMSVDIIKQGSEIRINIKELQVKIEYLEKALMNQRNKNKYPKDNIIAKEKRLKNYKTHLKLADERSKGEMGMTVIEEEPPLTLEQLQMQIQNDRTANTDARYKDDDMTAEEQAGLNAFGLKNIEIDRIAGEIDDNLGVLHEKVLRQGAAIEYTNVQVIENIKEVDKANKQIGLTNKKLKELVAKYRAPNKFCLDIVCLLLLLGLAAVVYNMVKG